MPQTHPPTRAFWICAVITALSAAVSAGFSVAALVDAGRHDQYARYAASRSIALAAAVLWYGTARSRRGVMALALTMALVQGLDGLIGGLAHDPSKTYGPLVLSLAGFASLVALHRRSGDDAASGHA